LDVLFPTGDARTLLPDRDLILFNAFIGSLGLLGLITAVTLQLEPIPSGYATVRRRSAASMGEIFTLFSEEEPQSDFMEAWLDGFARGDQLGRGFMTCGSIDHSGETVSALQPAGPGRLDRFETSLVRLAAGLARPVLHPAVHLANRANYWSGRWVSNFAVEQRAFYPYTYWSGAAFAGYHALLPEGVETYQAFVPAQYANEIFRQVLAYSQQQGCLPIWCVIKQHRRDPFLLSYQLDGFSLELNYQRTRQNTQTLERVLRHMIAVVIEAGGRFYLAKDHFLTHAQYRQSIGDGAVNTFLEIKRRCDPEMRLQSDLYRRVFQPAAA
jgi:FAD/FMN-containing dehydrogenase